MYNINLKITYGFYTNPFNLRIIHNTNLESLQLHTILLKIKYIKLVLFLLIYQITKNNNVSSIKVKYLVIICNYLTTNCT